MLNTVFRHQLPIIFSGNIHNQLDVFEFLVLHKHSADDDSVEDKLELVDDQQMELLIEEMQIFVALFYQV